ncbi:Protein NRT1/ PTR FAMILY 7.3 [Symbiodinium microadriaticum]|uniref:Protein NRT1/ PTR FAMILY 7.3 n=1 Tax=Symbiodinium microadriaticum TaxID=2951 RepID=A0A1Q9EUK0_SYMMI|nr:Protein NRT1/ PTR FAMILY 7.3 [Symbiodinium microadriaticum]
MFLATAHAKAAVPGGSLVSLLPPLLLLFPFYAAASQWTTSWYVQTLYCDRCVFGIVIPACLLQGFERLASLAVLTWLRSRTTVLRLKLPKRLGLGSVCAALAMLAAALVEVARRDWTPRLPGEPEVSSLSVAWLLPQFALIAAGEAFIYPASAEFLSSSPFAYGLGCAAQAGAVALLGLWLGYLKAWIPDGSPNQGHYDLFYLCLGGAGLVAGGLFVLLPIHPAGIVYTMLIKVPNILASTADSAALGGPSCVYSILGRASHVEAVLRGHEKWAQLPKKHLVPAFGRDGKEGMGGKGGAEGMDGMEGTTTMEETEWKGWDGGGADEVEKMGTGRQDEMEKYNEGDDMAARDKPYRFFLY